MLINWVLYFEDIGWNEAGNKDDKDRPETDRLQFYRRTTTTGPFDLVPGGALHLHGVTIEF